MKNQNIQKTWLVLGALVFAPLVVLSFVYLSVSSHDIFTHYFHGNATTVGLDTFYNSFFTGAGLTISTLAALGTCLSAGLTFWLIMMQQKQIEISREANRISVIKSEKDMIYQIHQTAIKILLENNKIINEKIDLILKRQRGGFDQIEFVQEINLQISLNEIKEILETYYSQTKVVIECKRSFEVESLRFYTELLTAIPTKTADKLQIFYNNANSESYKMLKEETKAKINNFKDIVFKINNASDNIIEHIKSRNENKNV